MSREEDDQFIIMGCDGIWERYVNNNQAMVEKISTLLQQHGNNQKVLETLLENMLAKGNEEEMGCDNMTAILIKFG